MPFSKADQFSAKLKRELDVVTTELEALLNAIMLTTVIDGKVNPDLMLRAQGEMMLALQASGYVDLVRKHGASYEVIAGDILQRLTKAGVPNPKFGPEAAQTLTQISLVDMQALGETGENIIKELNRSLYFSALSELPFNELVKQIEKSTGKLSSYAYTYANTASLKFSGEMARIIGEEVEADKWRVTGPLDETTREECRRALRNPVRTKQEWIDADYWGGTPGGWNCRHILEPVV